MLPKLREADTTQGTDASLAFLVLGPHKIDEELLSGFCLSNDLRGPIRPCSEAHVSWQGLQDLFITSIQESHMTFATTTRPATIADAVVRYAKLVSTRCPEAEVFLRRGSDDPSLVNVAVTVPLWDLALLEDLQRLVFSPDVRKEGVLLDVEVFFADVFVPELGEFTKVG